MASGIQPVVGNVIWYSTCSR